MNKTNESWLESRNKMLADWGTSDRGDLMLEYIAHNIPEEWPDLRHFVFVVSKFFQGLAWPVGMRDGADLAVVDDAAKTARRAMRWARREPPSSHEWNEIETEVLKAISFGKFRKAMAAAIPTTGCGHLFRVAISLRGLTRQIDRQEHIRDMLNRMAILARAIFPKPPEKKECSLSQ